MKKGTLSTVSHWFTTIALAVGISSQQLHSQALPEPKESLPLLPQDLPALSADEIPTEVIRDRDSVELPSAGLRRRAVGVNFALLQTPQSRMSFPLFDGSTVWGDLTEIKTVLGTVVLLTGTIEGVSEGAFHLAYEGSAAAGLIRLNEKTFSIRYVSEDLHMLVEDDPSEELICGVAGGAVGLELPESQVSSSSRMSALSSGSPAILDLLVVYSPAAFSAALRPNIVLGVERLNNALQRSQINASVDIIHIQDAGSTHRFVQ